MKGDDFIQLLMLPESDKRIIKMRSELKAPKPLLDKDFKEDGYTSILLEKLAVELFFSNGELFGLSGLYFTDIHFLKHCKLPLPYRLNFGDSYNEVLIKMNNKKEDFINNSVIDLKIWKETRKDGLEYLVYISFNDAEKLDNVDLATYEDKKEYLENH